MKQRNIFKLLLIVTSLGVWALASLTQGQEKPTQESMQKDMTSFAIKRLVIGTGVEDREPVGVGETFPDSTEKVYCFLEATDIAKDTEVSFVWFHGANEMRKLSFPVNTGTRWRTYSYKNLYGLKGDWKVEIRDAGGNLLKDVTFKVE